MESLYLDPVVIDHPDFKECTLLPLNRNPEGFRNYMAIQKTAQELDLKELPNLSHHEIQDLFLLLCQKLMSQKSKVCEFDPHISISVWLSGVHFSYPEIRLDDAHQVKELCITSLEIFYVDEDSPIEMTIAEYTVNEEWTIDFGDIIYCMFIGA